jgi:hypothetical protein
MTIAANVLADSNAPREDVWLWGLSNLWLNVT